jgi:hypothetical protein
MNLKVVCPEVNVVMLMLLKGQSNEKVCEIMTYDSGSYDVN